MVNYDDRCLRELVDHVADALDQYRPGQLDALAVDETIRHYHGAAPELWKCCWARGGLHRRMIARLIDDPIAAEEVIDWSKPGSPPRNRGTHRHLARRDPQPLRARQPSTIAPSFWRDQQDRLGGGNARRCRTASPRNSAVLSINGSMGSGWSSLLGWPTRTVDRSERTRAVRAAFDAIEPLKGHPAA